MQTRSVAVSRLLKAPLGPTWADRFGKALQSWSNKSVTHPIRTLSLFSGVGGLDIGFHDVGFNIVNMIEVDKRFVRTLEANSGENKYLGNATPLCEDIREYVPDRKPKIDFIIGGPPCQPFSAASRRAAGVRGSIDEDGDLFRDYVRLVRRMSPKGFLFENVVGLTNAENGETWKAIINSFKRAGYVVSYRILDAADYGVPQHRKRLFIVGLKKGEYKFPQPLFGPTSKSKIPYITARQALASLRLNKAEAQTGVNGKYGKLLNAIPPGLNYSFYTEKFGHPHPIFAWRSKFYDFLYKAHPDAPIRTLTAQGGQYSGPFHWNNRRFTLAELKRLQTIPDCYEVIGVQGPVRQQIGNAVPPQMARILGLTILNQVFKIELPFELPLMEENRSLKSSLSKPVVSNGNLEAQSKDPNREHKPKKKTQPRNYTAILSDNYKFAPSRRDKAHRIRFKPTATQWRITVDTPGKAKKTGFSIRVFPQEDLRWKLDVDTVMLSASVLSPMTFSLLWKAFEFEMAWKRVKADLVQLCGYYSYAPAFSCEMIFDSEEVDSKWKIVQQVVEGVGVRQILSKRRLARAWSIKESDVIESVLFLRSLGYDARNQKTNPRIKKDHFLIPYAFPSLNPASVQRHKALK